MSGTESERVTNLLKRKRESQQEEIEKEVPEQEIDSSREESNTLRKKLDTQEKDDIDDTVQMKKDLQGLNALREVLDVDRKQVDAARKEVDADRKKLDADRRQLNLDQQQFSADQQQRESSSTIPWRSWVHQKISTKSIVFGSCSSQKAYPNAIKDIRKWEDFREKVSSHINDCKYMSRAAGEFEILKRLHLNHDVVAYGIGHILLTMFKYEEYEFLTTKITSAGKRVQADEEQKEDPSSGMKAELKARASQVPLDKVDVEVLLGSKGILNVECKRPSCFRLGVTYAPPDLSTCPCPSGKKGELLARHRKCLNQVMRYMQNRDAGFAVLTSLDVSYFIRRHGKKKGDLTESIDISEGILLNSSGISLIGALHYILNLAISSKGNSYNDAPSNPADPESGSTFFRAPEERAQQSNDDDSITIGDQAQELKDNETITIGDEAQEAKDDDSVTIGDRAQESTDDSVTIGDQAQESSDDNRIADGDQDQPPSDETFARDTRPASEYERYVERFGNIFQEVAAEEFFLPMNPSATGWSGNIYFGKLWGLCVAVKLAEANCVIRQEALDNEARIYSLLRDLWGKCIPRLVAHGTTADGDVIFLATEVVNGSALWETTITPAVATKAREALVALHSRGILHGDLHEGNVLVSMDGVILLDFGSSHVVPPDSIECETEMGQLERMILNLQNRTEIGES